MKPEVTSPGAMAASRLVPASTGAERINMVSNFHLSDTPPLGRSVLTRIKTMFTSPNLTFPKRSYVLGLISPHKQINNTNEVANKSKHQAKSILVFPTTES